MKPIDTQSQPPHRPVGSRRAIGAWGSLAVAALLATTAAAPLRAQSSTPATPVAAARRLSLDEALRMAETQSEAVQIARAGVTRASGQQLQARSQYLPQVSGTASYARTLRSQFSALAGGGGGPDTGIAALPSVCSPNIPANATPAERNAALAQSVTCAPAGAGIDFTKVGFGARNQWALGLNVSQNVFAGGRIASQNQAANAAARSANIEVTAQRAQLALDVTQAYYDAALADRLVSITESALSQTEEVLRQTRVARQVGNQSEFELLRAQVSRDNQLPQVIQSRGNRQVAYFRLKQLLNVSLDDSLQLTTALDDSSAAATTAIVTAAASVVHPGAAVTPVVDTSVAERAPVRQLAENVRAQEAFVRVARGQRFPAIQITSGYQRLFYPNTVFPTQSDFRENWTVGASLSVPIFTGGRIRGDEMVAQANLAEARVRLQQTREFAALDARVALNTLEQAEATLRASQGTTGQAVRAYSIDQIRYREGISTQTDLTQSRLLLEQSLANRALAARDVAVARVRLALIRDLPLQAPSAGAVQAQSQAIGAGAGTGASSGAAPQQQQQPRTSTQAAAASVGGGPGGVQP
jgi:outer membrane protein